ncbi:MAG: DUF2804 domain-containing protein, partial [Clostridia bacterium]|nr:DUF2804 domain-containing protein [Clostridia bacterium]
MQNQITQRTRLLKEDGSLASPGYAVKPLFIYDRNDIKACGFKIKEWDYYYVGNKDYAVCMTIADNSYMALVSVTLLDFRTLFQQTISKMKFFTFGKLDLPSTAEKGDVEFSAKGFYIKFTNDGVSRNLVCHCENFFEGKTLDIDVALTDFPEESMVIATPFTDAPQAFYYNQKINCMTASGSAKLAGEVYSFDGNGAMGLLDWGRGVWTYKNTWYWGSLSTKLPNGDKFGFNIGYGFGDTSAATENMLFLNGKAHKLSEVAFNIPLKDGKDDFMSPWTFSSDDGRFEMDFEPLLNRYANINLGVLCSVQNQVFGYFSG